MPNTRRSTSPFPAHMAVALLGMTALLGCSESSDGGASGGGAGAAGAAGASGVAVFGIASLLSAPTSPTGDWTLDGPFAGLEVCVDEAAPRCTTSAADGSYRLEGVAADSQIVLLMQSPGVMETVLTPRVTAATDFPLPLSLATTATLNGFMTGSGCSLPPATGTGTLWIGAPPGSSATATPALANPIVYVGASGAFDPTATAIDPGVSTAAAGAVACGLAPGEYDLDFAGTTGACAMVEGWPVSGHDMRVVIQAGAMTVVNWVCQ